MIIDPEVLPEGLPEPEDDGAASHLVGEADARPRPAIDLRRGGARRPGAGGR